MGFIWRRESQFRQRNKNYYNIKSQKRKGMDEEISHRRIKSHFSKGMSLEDYLRGMSCQEETVPTADTQNQYMEMEGEGEESLYRTSNQFYNPNQKLRVIAMKEIQEENFEDSLDSYQSINIISSQIGSKKIPPSYKEEVKKNYRIRNSSPYSCGKQPQFNPQKTFIKKATLIKDSEQTMPILAKTLYGKGFEIRKSSKNIKVEEYETKMKDRGSIEKMQNQFLRKMEKSDFRLESLKDRLQQKKKGKKQIT